MITKQSPSMLTEIDQCIFSLAFWRWQHKYVQPKKVGIAPFVQVAIGSMIFFYALNYGKMSKLLHIST